MIPVHAGCPWNLRPPWRLQRKEHGEPEMTAQLNVQYDPASRTALLQYGSRSTVLRDLPTREAAEAAARQFAITNWGYSDGARGE